jgi:hypothetical protein
MHAALARKIQTCCSGDANFFASLTRRHRKKVKTLRKQCAVVILTLTMAVSAYAGILQTPGCVGTGGTDTTTNQLTDVTTTIIVTIVTTVP